MVSALKTGNQFHQRLLDKIVGGGLTLAAFGLYLTTLAPTVLEADGGEFQFVPWLPGIAHPTGYPLYVLLGWLWTHLLPLGEVAWRMNLLSAVLAAVAVGFTYTVARQMLDVVFPDTSWGARIIAAMIAGTTFAVSQTFWSQAIIAEVYALHALFVAAILWLANSLSLRGVFTGLRSASDDENAQRSVVRCRRSISWLAFTVGLSLTHHRAIVLLLPALVVFLWHRHHYEVKASAEPTRLEPAQASTALPLEGGGLGWGSPVSRRWLTYGLLLIAPLLLYLYLPLIAPFTSYATLRLSETQTLILYDNSPVGFWSYVTGSVFTGELRPAAAGWDRLWLAWQLLHRQFGWVGVGLAINGLISLWWRRKTDLLLLTGLGFLAFVAFNLIYFIGDVFVLFIPAWLLVSLWLGLGCLGVAHWLARSFVQRRIGSAGANLAFGPMEQRLGRKIYNFLNLLFVVPGLLLPMVLLASNYNMVNQSHNFAARERWQTTLTTESIPTGAVLVSNDRNEIMPMWYYQYVEGLRPDLLGLFPLIVSDPAYANVGRVLDQALASGRPVYLIKPMTGLEIKADLLPAGTLFQARAYPTSPAYLVNKALPPVTFNSSSSRASSETINLVGYDLSPAQIRSGAPITITLQWRAIQPLSVDYTSYVHLVNKDGQGITQSDHRPGGDFYPSHYWQVDEILHDRHSLNIPANLPEGVYQLRVGMYYLTESGAIVGMGNGIEIGSVTIKP